MEQLHKRFNTGQVKELFFYYEKEELTRGEIQKTLNISKSHFFELIKEYRQNPKELGIEYKRAEVSKLSQETESLMREELNKEYSLINNPQI
ncbi:MAG: hypothetical protein LBD61_05900 [Endomicrobium sp.]|jgi:arsenate reductase-like glutaredoxin family protein|nr:hypothetical protein [Endomicrobium sp.]